MGRNEADKIFTRRMAIVYAGLSVAALGLLTPQLQLPDPPEKQTVSVIPMNLETLIREQNKNGLKKRIGTEIELKLEKEVSTQLFEVQEGYIPVHGTFTDNEGKSTTFGMALDPTSPLGEYFKRTPNLSVDTKIEMKVIPSPNTYLVKAIIPPKTK